MNQKNFFPSAHKEKIQGLDKFNVNLAILSNKWEITAKFNINTTNDSNQNKRQLWGGNNISLQRLLAGNIALWESRRFGKASYFCL